MRVIEIEGLRVLLHMVRNALISSKKCILLTLLLVEMEKNAYSYVYYAYCYVYCMCFLIFCYELRVKDGFLCGYLFGSELQKVWVVIPMNWM